MNNTKTTSYQIIKHIVTRFKLDNWLLWWCPSSTSNMICLQIQRTMLQRLDVIAVFIEHLITSIRSSCHSCMNGPMAFASQSTFTIIRIAIDMFNSENASTCGIRFGYHTKNFNWGAWKNRLVMHKMTFHMLHDISIFNSENNTWNECRNTKWTEAAPFPVLYTLLLKKLTPVS